MTPFTSRRPEARTDPADPDLRTPDWCAETPFGVVVQLKGQRPLRNVVVGPGVPRVELVTGQGLFPAPGALALEGAFAFPMTISVDGERGTVDQPHRGRVPLQLTRRSRTLRVVVGAHEWQLRATGRSTATVSRDGRAVLTVSGAQTSKHRVADDATPTDLAVALALTPVLGTLSSSLFLV